MDCARFSAGLVLIGPADFAVSLDTRAEILSMLRNCRFRWKTSQFARAGHAPRSPSHLASSLCPKSSPM